MNDKMRQVKSISEKYDTIFVDTQEAFDKMLNYYYSGFYAGDRIHPNTSGHMVIARTFMNAGMNWNKK